jgi:hypothetical protein
MMSSHDQREGAGAGDGIRTRDILLGKQTLCQLSYSRSGGPNSTDRLRPRLWPMIVRAGHCRTGQFGVPATRFYLW